MNSTLIARGGVPLKLDRDRVLFYDMQATWLLVKEYGLNFITALYSASPSESGTSIELKNIEALQVFCWIGLMTDAREQSEELTKDRVSEFITPYTLPTIFSAVVQALMRELQSPDLPGKEDAVTSSPDRTVRKSPGPKLASTSTKRSGSRSRR